MANINAIKLPDGNKYNLVDETSGYITSSDLPTPLIGTTANTTPTQVVTALAAGRNIEITHTDTTYGDVIAYSFNYAEDIGRISSNAAISVFGTLILTKLVGNTNDNTWNFEAHELAQLSNIPTATSDLTNDSGFVTTDENLKTTALDIGNSMYLIGGSSSESTGTKLTDGALLYTRYLNGRCWLSIGKASTEGILRLFNAKSGGVYTTLRPNADITTSNTIYLPDSDGTLALTSDILTKTSDLTNDSGFVTTDEKVRVSALSSNTVYYPILASGTGTAVRQVDSTYNGFRYCSIAGTTSSIGSAQLQLGNSIASGSENNERGKLTIYGKTAYAHTIQGAPTAARTLTLPDKAGTFALIDDIPISTDVPTASTISEFDSTAHMNSTDMTAAEVTSFVNGLNMTASKAADYIVEEGTNGDISYRKWQSGIAECWLRTTQNVAFAQYGSSSIYVGQYVWTFPIEFTHTPVVTCSEFKWGTGASWGYLGSVTTTTANLRGGDIAVRAAGSCTITAYAIGRWK